MKRNTLKAIAVIAGVLFISLFVIELDAYARAGGGRSFGSRGSRSYSSPSRSNSGSSTSSSAARPQATPAPVQSAPAGGGFMRGMGGGLLGGIMGGLLGGMLFSSLGHAGMGGLGGSGIGIFEIVLILVIGFLIYRMVTRKKREEGLAYQTAFKQGSQTNYQQDIPPAYGSGGQSFGGGTAVAEDGMAHIRQFDPNFDEARFNDSVMDIFFKIQGAWTNRDMSTAASLLTDEMRKTFQEDIDRLLKEKKVNRLENIAVRKVDITEAWQESGQDFITALVYANLLDYTTDDLTGQVVSGSRTEPVKFEEFWTFTRPVGGSSWRLSAINQA